MGEDPVNQKIFHRIGWFLLFVLGLSWLIFGYSSWYLLLLSLSYISLSISDGSFKKLARLSISQLVTILIAFLLSVGLVFVLIQLANYVINDQLHLTGVSKTVSQVIAIIISLYPVKFTFASLVYKVYDHANANQT